jgi:hypothetical protein
MNSGFLRQLKQYATLFADPAVQLPRLLPPLVPPQLHPQQPQQLPISIPPPPIKTVKLKH